MNTRRIRVFGHLKGPKISFTVICYNREKYIHECMDSILSQDIEKEIICIDDCSTDNTYGILSDYQNKYPEVKVFRNDMNKGTVITRNEGMRRCTGEYMIFIDADDKVIGSYSELYGIAKTAKADILEFSAETDSENKNLYNMQRNDETLKGNLLDLYSKGKISNTLWNKLISQKTYRKASRDIVIESPQPNYSDVVFFMFHILKHAKTCVSTCKVGYYYYSSRGMTSQLSSIDRLKQYCSFSYTKHDLEMVYGAIPELHNTWNKVCNQAVCTWLELNEKAQNEYYPLLLDLMSEINAQFLINEYRKKSDPSNTSFS